MKSPIFATWIGCALMTIAATGSPRERQEAEVLASCTACRMDFMKCVAQGAGLPAEPRKEVKHRCAEVAAKCFEGCTPEDHP